MNGKFKITLIIALVLLSALCFAACGSRSNDPYTAYEITKVDIVQKGTNTFGYTVQCDIAPSDNAKVYITHYDRIGTSDSPITYTANEGKYVFDATVKYASYYIFVVDGDKTAVLPMTKPQMAPSLSSTANSNILTYNFVPGTSWSSFCDPTGKSVYKSSNTVFDDSASLVAKNVNIAFADSTTDSHPSKEQPYYYVVLSAKNGIVTYVSAPIMTLERAYSNIRVSLETVDNKPMLKVSGKFVIDGEIAVELYSSDTKLGKVIEIVGESVTGKKGDEFTAMLDASQVVNGTKGAGIWYDIKLATSTGSLYEIASSKADMSQVINDGNIMFEFQEYNSILKLNYQYRDYTVSEVNIVTDSGVPTLVVKGTYAGKIGVVKLHGDVQATGAQNKELLWDNLSDKAGEFEFRVDLTTLPTDGTPWTWFHIYTYTSSMTNLGKDNLIRGSLLSIGQTFTADGKLFTVKAYNNTGSQLAIQSEKK